MFIVADLRHSLTKYFATVGTVFVLFTFRFVLSVLVFNFISCANDRKVL